MKRLTDYNETCIPMHMPGHKRNSEMLDSLLPYELDITEINGFDNLHNMGGILKATASLAASLYGSKEAYPLVGGSSCGILAAVHALAPFGSHVLMARNCHKSVYNAVELMGLHPHYLITEPDEFGIIGKITPEAVDSALQKEQNISLVIVTSPTYEGVISDTEKIAEICHRHNALLFVDSAHGAHVGFSPYFGRSAVHSGADAVVMSLHKTLPALTQSALLHICTDAVDRKKIGEALSVFETSSPSYVLLASIDQCLRIILKDGKALFANLNQNLAAFYEETKRFDALSVLKYDDPSKTVVSAKKTPLTGTDLADILRKEYKIETEMAGTDYILAMTSICDSKENIMRFADALKQIDKSTPCIKNFAAAKKNISLPKYSETPFSARQKNGAFMPLCDAEGFECLEYIWAYPPGIPLIVPGEIIGRSLIAKITGMAQAKIDIKSTKGFTNNQIWVAKS